VFSTTAIGKRLELGLGVYNLFNRTYADPGSEEHVQSSIPQDGRTLRVQLSANLRVLYRVEIENLHEADSGGFHGLTSLYTFFASRTMWGLSPFDLTHDDGGTVTVRLVDPFWGFTETLRGRWTGTLTFLKVL
jgi:hypothetical protein